MVDSKYIDVKFDEQPEYTFGCIEKTEFFGSAPYAEDVIEILPENRLIEEYEKNKAVGASAANMVTRIYNQGNEGSCVGNATAQAIEVLQAIQFGIDNVVPISAISVYKHIGSSPNSGATIEDACEAIQTIGALPLDTPENRAKFGNIVMPHTGFRTPFPEGYEKVAADFQAFEVFKIRNTAAMKNCLVRPDIVVIVGREGHSVLYVEPEIENRRTWNADYVNSWGKWGFGKGRFDYGFGRDTMRQIEKSSYFAFGIRAIRTST